MKELEDFLPYVLPAVPGCTTLMAKQALRSTLRDFCDQTNIVQQTFTLDAVINVPDYDISVPTEQELCRVLYVGYRNRELSLVPYSLVTVPNALRQDVPEAETPVSDPSAAYVPGPGETFVYLYPTPAETTADLITVKASFYPLRTCDLVEDILFYDWVDTIAAGTLANLLSLPGQDFTSNKFSDYRRVYASGIAQARSEGRRGATQSSMRVRPRLFSY